MITELYGRYAKNFVFTYPYILQNYVIHVCVVTGPALHNYNK